LGGLGQLLLDDLVAQVDALVADVDARSGDELLHLLLRLAAEGALEQIGVAEPTHAPPSLLPKCSPLANVYEPAAAAAASFGSALRVAKISSMIPYSLACSAVMMKSRSVSCLIFSSVCPVCSERISSSSCRYRRISLAWISMSTA